MTDEIPQGVVGLVEADERQRKDEAELEKYTKRSVQATGRHVLSEQEDLELDDKLEKQRAVQEKVRARQAAAEAKDPSLKERNPHLL